MKIQNIELTEEHQGQAVTYVPRHGDRERGEIVRWNDSFVFVRYQPAGTPQATNPKDLVWG